MAIEFSVNGNRPLQPFGLSPSTSLRTGLSKGMSEEVQCRFGKLRTGFDRIRANGDFVMCTGTLKLIAAGTLLLAPSWAQAAPDTAGSLFTVLLSLVLILGGFIAIAWFARRYLPGMGAQGAVKVVGTTAVGARERVVVVEVDHTWLLLGVGGGNVRLLHTLPKPDSSKTTAERT
jgi:flagellar protein FliO/FliZ